MHASLVYLMTAVLLIQPAAAQPERQPGQTAADKRPPVSLGDMEALCRAGRRSSCEDADRLRAQVNDRMRAEVEARAGSRPESTDIARPVRQGDVPP